MIFIVVGMPAAGKNIAREYAESKNIPYFATGDLVRAEVKKQGLEANAENTKQVSDKMRGEDGMGVTRYALTSALAAKSKAVFMEGMRSLPEIALVKEKADAVVIAFLAPRKMRLSRIASRGRADDSIDAFDARDQREIAYGASVPIALADEYILNTDTMKDAISALDEIVKNYTVK